MEYHAMIAGRLVRTFNHPELAQSYAERMRVIGVEVEVRVVVR